MSNLRLCRFSIAPCQVDSARNKRMQPLVLIKRTWVTLTPELIHYFSLPFIDGIPQYHVIITVNLLVNFMIEIVIMIETERIIVEFIKPKEKMREKGLTEQEEYDYFIHVVPDEYPKFL